jgi:hypothetical protein
MKIIEYKKLIRKLENLRDKKGIDLHKWLKYDKLIKETRKKLHREIEHVGLKFAFSRNVIDKRV